MAEDHVWSASCGRWFGIPVRVHVFMLLFVALVFGVEWHYRHLIDLSLQGTALVTVLILLGSIIIHELAHLFAVTNLGGHCNSMLLTPWGGNSDYTMHESGRARTIVHLAGPFANGMIFLFGATILVQHGNLSLESLVNPFQPHGFRASQWELSILKIVTWINFQLTVVNMLPCFPFDGAAVMRSAIQALDVDLPRHRIESAIMAMGQGLAFTLIGIAWLLRGYEGGSVQPAWSIFLVGGIVLVFAARYSFARETAFEEPDWDDIEGAEYDSMYEDSDFFHFAESEENGPYSQWLIEKQKSREFDDENLEAFEEQQADKILVKLHDSGIDDLTDEEKSLLDRVSERIRRKREQGVARG